MIEFLSQDCESCWVSGGWEWWKTGLKTEASRIPTVKSLLFLGFISRLGTPCKRGAIVTHTAKTYWSFARHLRLDVTKPYWKAQSFAQDWITLEIVVVSCSFPSKQGLRKMVCSGLNIGKQVFMGRCFDFLPQMKLRYNGHNYFLRCKIIGIKGQQCFATSGLFRRDIEALSIENPTLQCVDLVAADTRAHAVIKVDVDNCELWEAQFLLVLASLLRK